LGPTGRKKNILKKLLAAITLFLTFILIAAGFAAPSTASTSNDVVKVQQRKAWGTSVSHSSSDSGYTRDIHVVCNTGKHVYLSPGQSTFLGATEAESCSLSGVDRIIVAYNQTVYCKNLVPPYQNRYFYTGTTYFGSNQTWKCYDQWPL